MGEIKPFSYNFNNKTIEKDIAIRINTGKKKMIEITTDNGNKVLASTDHQWFIFENGVIKLKQTKDLNISDRIITI